jgi:hypothetical protein
MIVHPPVRGLELFFSGHKNDRAPARQRTRTFFSGHNNDRAPARQTTRTFFSSCNNDRAPARQTTRTFFSGSSSPREAWEVPPAPAKRVYLTLYP